VEHSRRKYFKESTTLNFLRRNLKYCPTKSKETAYFALVRSTVEYSSSVWNPHLKKDVVNLEKINRRAAWFVMNDDKLQSSVTEMLDKLEWPSLEHRRKNQRLTTMFKITQGLVAVPYSYLTPADFRTRANHIYKLKSSETFQHLHQPTRIHSFLKQFRNGTVCTRTSLRRHLWAASRIVCSHSPSVCIPRWRDIPPGVCRLHSKTRTRTTVRCANALSCVLCVLEDTQKNV